VLHESDVISHSGGQLDAPCVRKRACFSVVHDAAPLCRLHTTAQHDVLHGSMAQHALFESILHRVHRHCNPSIDCIVSFFGVIVRRLKILVFSVRCVHCHHTMMLVRLSVCPSGRGVHFDHTSNSLLPHTGAASSIVTF